MTVKIDDQMHALPMTICLLYHHAALRRTALEAQLLEPAIRHGNRASVDLVRSHIALVFNNALRDGVLAADNAGNLMLGPKATSQVVDAAYDIIYCVQMGRRPS